MENQLVVFDLGVEHFSVNITMVDSIVKMQDITSVPRSLSFVEGVTNLRGTVLPIIDLRKRLNLEVTEATSETRIIVVQMDELKVGMIVDAVSEVLTISDTAIDPTPPMVSSIDSDFITGIAKINGRLVIMLDLERVLTNHEKMALD